MKSVKIFECAIIAEKRHLIQIQGLDLLNFYGLLSDINGFVLQLWVLRQFGVLCKGG
jgi:type IV secretory pathway TrbD component